MSEDACMARLAGMILLLPLAILPGCYRSPPPATIPPRPAGELKTGLKFGNLAPEIEGQDADGKSFKLSDYRGKVVLLDFWYER
jgi:cytochrome oxidase Cu insertion factor (SCO1/SenC/PrrC family)